MNDIFENEKYERVQVFHFASGTHTKLEKSNVTNIEVLAKSI